MFGFSENGRGLHPRHGCRCRTAGRRLHQQMTAGVRFDDDVTAIAEDGTRAPRPVDDAKHVRVVEKALVLANGVG